MAANSTRLSESPISEVPYLGRKLSVTIRRTPFASARLSQAGGSITIDIPAAFSNEHVEDEAKRLLYDWLRAQARFVLCKKVKDFCENFGLAIGSVRIKDTRSRWGSCSVRRNLNFNWRLIMAPPWVIDYLIVHETAHLDEMNHSERFWRIVAQRCPDYRSHEAWLKTCGISLLRW